MDHDLTKDGRRYPLTPKQERFCQEYMTTGNASEAYRRSYAAGSMKPNAIHHSSSQLMDNPKVAYRIATLKASLAKAVDTSLSGISAMMAHAYEIAEREGQGAAMAQAAFNLAKLHGHVVDRSKTEVLDERAKDAMPDIDAMIARARGMRRDDPVTH